MSDYPTDAEIAEIENWSYGAPVELVDRLRELWWMPSFGFHFAEVKDDLDGTPGLALHLSTGGWSGNEDLIDALRKAMGGYGFWGLYWYSHHRGGHYEFRFPGEQFSNGLPS